jgi:hypothetical protein
MGHIRHPLSLSLSLSGLLVELVEHLIRASFLGSNPTARVNYTRQSTFFFFTIKVVQNVHPR